MRTKDKASNPKRGLVRRFFGSFVDVKTWMGYGDLKRGNKGVVDLLRKLSGSHNRQPNLAESYEEAVARMRLTEEQLIRRQKDFFNSSLVYALAAILFLIYLIYLLVMARWLAATFTLSLLGLTAISAYHEHFWYFQMKSKKLGCSFHEWLQFVLGRKTDER